MLSTFFHIDEGIDAHYWLDNNIFVIDGERVRYPSHLESTINFAPLFHL